MSTGYQELTTSATVWAWEALKSPQPCEVIYRRGPMLVFCQFDREGKLREATLRRMIAANRPLTTQLRHIGWHDGNKIARVVEWFADFGEQVGDRAKAAGQGQI